MAEHYFKMHSQKLHARIKVIIINTVIGVFHLQLSDFIDTPRVRREFGLKQVCAVEKQCSKDGLVNPNQYRRTRENVLYGDKIIVLIKLVVNWKI